ncbi:MAG: hypothetical protein HKP25_15050 [Marinicaulis sp.]|nr:hypothetical protein [Marinicaulis sp.]
MPIVANYGAALKKWAAQPTMQRLAWAVAVIVFIGGVALSIRANPKIVQDIDYALLGLILFVLCPVMTAANMLITREIGRVAGANLDYAQSLRLAVMATAINHLPAPGGAILRTAAYHDAGATLKDAAIANAVGGFAWMGVTFLQAGLFGATVSFTLGSIFFGIGAALTIASIWMARKRPGRLKDLPALFGVCALSAFTYAICIVAAVRALGESAAFAQAVFISTSGVIGAAASIAPSGLGIREAAAAGLGVLINVDPAAAFSATALVHIAMIVIMGLCAVFFAASERAPAS